MEDMVKVGEVGQMNKTMGGERIRNEGCEGQVSPSRNTYIIKLIKKKILIRAQYSF